MDNTETWTELPVEESIRMTEDRDNRESTSTVCPTLGLRTVKNVTHTHTHTHTHTV